MKTYLKTYIWWKVQIYKTEDFYNFATNNLNNFNLLLFQELCSPCDRQDGAVQNTRFFFLLYVDKFYILILAFSLLCIFGNGITIAHEIHCLIKRKITDSKERKIHHILVLN